MYADTLIFDPDSLDYLSPETQKAVLAARVKYAKTIADLAPEHAVALPRVHAALASVHAATRVAQTAQADLVVFEESVGAQAIGAAAIKALGVTGLLGVTALAETSFAFPGVRFATGQLGQIQSPLEDPLSLAGAAVIGLISVMAAHLAAENFCWSERSLMRDPEPAEISHELRAPRAVHADPENAKLMEESPLAEYAETPGLGETLDSTEAEPVESVPPSQEVVDAEIKRHEQVARGGRSKGLCRKIGIGLVVFGLGLWAANGVMRSGYLDRLPKPAAPTTSGIFAAGAMPVAKATGLSDGASEAAIIAVSMLLFLLSVAIVFAVHTPAELRGKELRRRKSKAERSVLKKVKEAEKAIRAFEKVRCAIDVQKIEGRAVDATARLPRDDS